MSINLIVMPPEILQFIAISLALEVTPGPAVLFVLYQSAHGMRHVLLAVLGLLCANVLWISLVATGLGLLLVSTPTLFSAMRYIGAIYLAYLGYKIARYGIGVSDTSGSIKLKSSWQSFQQGVMTSLSNPKALLFFLALFPQFTRADHFIDDVIVFGSLKMILLALVMISYGFMGKQLFRCMLGSVIAKWGFHGLGLLILLAAFGVAFG